MKGLGTPVLKKPKDVLEEPTRADPPPFEADGLEVVGVLNGEVRATPPPEPVVPEPAPVPKKAPPALPPLGKAVEKHKELPETPIEEPASEPEKPQVEAEELPAWEGTSGVEPVEAQGDAQAPVEAEQPAKRRQVRKATSAPGKDGGEMLAWLQRPIVAEDTDDTEAVMAELRTLRDMQIAISRRAANLSLEALKKSKSAVEAVAAISALMPK